jgi:protein-S-isoprenylcysteine O-methyltransferase Ste14
VMRECGADQGSIAWWILIVCWSLFACVWLIGSVYNSRHSGKIQQRGGYSWHLIVLAAVTALAFLPQAIWRALVVCTWWLPAVGAVVLIGATAFTIWARVVLGRMWSSMPVKRAGHELRTDGPYRVTRHPIYTGLIGMVLGTALVNGVGVWGAAAVLLMVGLTFKLRVEERLMREAFGDAYATYEARVPGLLPWPRPGK